MKTGEIKRERYIKNRCEIEKDSDIREMREKKRNDADTKE